MTELRFHGQAPSQVGRYFLELLDDVYRIHGLFLDEITTLRARVAELEGSKPQVSPDNAFNQGVPDVPGCAVYLVSMDGTIMSWSSGASQLYGYSAEEAIGQNPDWLRSEGSTPRTRERHTLAGAPISSRVGKDGQVFEVYLHDALLQDKCGQTVGRMHLEIPLENTHGSATPGDGGIS